MSRKNQAGRLAIRSLRSGVSVAALASLWGGAAIAQQQDAAAPGDEIIVQGSRYFTESTNLTRADARLVEIPNSLTVLSNELLEDQITIDFRDALRNVAGVSFARNVSGSGEYDEILLRGIGGGASGVSTLLRENGLPGGVNYPIDPYLIERVEIIKGPSSIAGGGAAVGGLVNRVLKQPTGEDSNELLLVGNSFGKVRGGLDINQALSDDGDLAGRLVLAGQFGEESAERETESHIAVSPSLTYQLGDATEIKLIGQYFQNGGRPFIGLAGSAITGAPDVAADFNIDYDDDDTLRDESHLSIFTEVVHEFLDDLTLTARVGLSQTTSDVVRVYSFNYAPGISETGDTDIYAAFEGQVRDNFAGDIFLAKDFSVNNGLQSSVVVGVDRVVQDFDKVGTYQFLGTDNLFNPQTRFDVPVDIRQNNLFQDFAIQLKQTGVYSQLVLRPVDRLTLISGVRYDWLDQFTDVAQTLVENGILLDRQIDTTDSAFTWRAGGSFEVGFQTNLYASYSESFLANSFSFQSNGDLLPAERGRQVEAGFKSNFLGDNLLLTTSVFRIVRDNVAVEDPDDPRFALPAGEEVSKGVEIEAVGEIAPGLSIVAAYTYLDAEITDDGIPDDSPDTQFDGEAKLGVADHQLSAFATYEVQSGPLQGFGGGFGLFYRSDQPVAFNNPGTIDSFVKYDLTLFYRDVIDGVDIRLFWDNITDKRYVPGKDSFNSIRFGDRSNVTVSLTAAF